MSVSWSKALDKSVETLMVTNHDMNVVKFVVINPSDVMDVMHVQEVTVVIVCSVMIRRDMEDLRT